ncbi:fibronectin type III domain-containing protein [Bacillus paranthracis]
MFIVCLSVLPSLASADEFDNATPTYRGTFDWYMCAEQYCPKGKIADKETYFARVNESFVLDVKSIRLTMSSENSLYQSILSFYDNDKKLIRSFPLIGLKNMDYDTYGVRDLKGVRYVSLRNNSGADIFLRRFYISTNTAGVQGYFPFELEEINSLNAIEGVNDVSFTWKNPTSSNFTGVKIFREDTLVADVGKDVTSYKVTDLKANENYNFKFISMYGKNSSQGVQKGVKTLIDPKTVPPGPVSSFTAEPTDKTVKLKWKKPKDDDLAGFKILQNGKQVAEIGLEEEFTVKNLQPLTDYTFGVIAVDRDKNDSSPVNLSVKTLEEKDEEPPHVPSNVFAKPSNGALIASWDKVSDKDLAGYNVYVDDKKINSNLVSSTNFTIKNLENNRKYKIQVQAVDRSGNASALSLAAYGTPDEKTLPIIESKYSLQDVSDGVSVMFGQFWTVLAFAVGIPLAFYIIYKLKLTVLP